MLYAITVAAIYGNSNKCYNVFHQIIFMWNCIPIKYNCAVSACVGVVLSSPVYISRMIHWKSINWPSSQWCIECLSKIILARQYSFVYGNMRYLRNWCACARWMLSTGKANELFSIVLLYFGGVLMKTTISWMCLYVIYVTHQWRQCISRFLGFSLPLSPLHCSTQYIPMNLLFLTWHLCIACSIHRSLISNRWPVPKRIKQWHSAESMHRTHIQYKSDKSNKMWTRYLN